MGLLDRLRAKPRPRTDGPARYKDGCGLGILQRLP
jgi:hypothetical protein